jgi:hypothetical protein
MSTMYFCWSTRCPSHHTISPWVTVASQGKLLGFVYLYLGYLPSAFTGSDRGEWAQEEAGHDQAMDKVINERSKAHIHDVPPRWLAHFGE